MKTVFHAFPNLCAISPPSITVLAWARMRYVSPRRGLFYSLYLFCNAPIVCIYYRIWRIGKYMCISFIMYGVNIGVIYRKNVSTIFPNVRFTHFASSSDVTFCIFTRWLISLLSIILELRNLFCSIFVISICIFRRSRGAF